MPDVYMHCSPHIAALDPTGTDPLVYRIVTNAMNPPTRGGWVPLPRNFGDANLIDVHPHEPVRHQP